MFKLEKFQASSEIEQLGTVGELTPKGASIRFLKNNFLNKDKRVVIHVANKDGLMLNVALTGNLSNAVRAARAAGKEKRELLAWITTLPVIKNEKGMFVSMPQDTTSESYSVDQLTEDAAKGTFEPEELVAF